MTTKRRAKSILAKRRYLRKRTIRNLLARATTPAERARVLLLAAVLDVKYPLTPADRVELP